MSLACECVLTYEVVIKHIPVLDALKGLDLVCVIVSTGIDLVQQHPQVQQLIFPAALSKIDVSELRQLIKYDQTDDSTAKAAEYFQKYLNELNNRGTEILNECILRFMLIVHTHPYNAHGNLCCNVRGTKEIILTLSYL